MANVPGLRVSFKFTEPKGKQQPKATPKIKAFDDIASFENLTLADVLAMQQQQFAVLSSFGEASEPQWAGSPQWMALHHIVDGAAPKLAKGIASATLKLKAGIPESVSSLNDVDMLAYEGELYGLAKQVLTTVYLKSAEVAETHLD